MTAMPCGSLPSTSQRRTIASTACEGTPWCSGVLGGSAEPEAAATGSLGAVRLTRPPYQGIRVILARREPVGRCHRGRYRRAMGLTAELGYHIGDPTLLHRSVRAVASSSLGARALAHTLPAMDR